MDYFTSIYHSLLQRDELVNAEKANFMEALLILRSAHNSVAVIMLIGRCAVTHLQIVSVFYQSTGVLVRQFNMALLLRA